MKYTGKLILGVFGLLLTGCATTHQYTPAPEVTAYDYSKARMYVVRPYAYGGSAWPIPVYDNAQLVGKVGFDKPLCWERQPGPVRITTDPPRIPGAQLHARQGAIYYFVIQMDWLLGAQVRQVDEAYGKQLLAKGGIAQSSNAPLSGAQSQEFKPPDVLWFVVTDPPGANIEFDGVYQGKSPTLIARNVLDPASSEQHSLVATPATLDYPSLGFLCGFSFTNNTLIPTPDKDLDVTLVFPGSQALAMGLLPGDRITRVNDKTVTNGLQMVTAIRDSGFGGDVHLLVSRAGKDVQVSGRTHAQNRGTLYRHQKQYPTYQLSSMNLQTIFFDLKVPSPFPVNVSGDPSAAPAPGGVSMGSGFIIGTNGYVLTCHHVVQGRQDIKVRFADGKERKAKIVIYDEHDDWCLLQVPESSATPLSIAPRESLKSGLAVYCLGYPMEGVLKSSEPVAGAGNIASLQGINGDRSHIQITIPINPGNSGSPIVDSRGRWLAVASHKLSDLYSLVESGAVPQGLNFATKASVIEPVLAEVKDLQLLRAGFQEDAQLDEIASRCGDSIVLVVAQ